MFFYKKMKSFTLLAVIFTCPYILNASTQTVAPKSDTLTKDEIVGISATNIIFGQSTALKGPASELGNGMQQGLLAAFTEVNKAGGINGRQVHLISKDDGYEPDKAIENTKFLIETQKVFALIGEVGTPTSNAAQPIATAKKIPFIAPFTGAEFLRNPYNPFVINLRGSYFEETEKWVEYLLKNGKKRIALLYQDDSFGNAGRDGLKKALEKRGLNIISEGTFKRNTIAVKTALMEIQNAQPDAIGMVGTYKPIAEFVRKTQKLAQELKSPLPTFITLSFVGSDALAQDLGKNGEGVLVTQVVPLPTDISIPIVAKYQKALKEANADAKPGFVSLEGYMAGRLVIQALKNIGKDVTRQKFIDYFATNRSIDLDGITLTYGPNKNQGMNKIYVTEIRNGNFIDITNETVAGGNGENKGAQ